MVSCDNGNDDNKYSSDIIGTWAWYKDFFPSEGWDEWEEGDDLDIVIFEKGGSGMSQYYWCDRYGDYELEETDYFEWSIKGNKLTIESYDEGEDSARIVSLTDEELVIEWEDEGETGKSYYLRID